VFNNPYLASQPLHPASCQQTNIDVPFAETAVPYMAFKKAGFEVHFATEKGHTPECDQKMLKGITQKLLVTP
jgi:hypothetical protein